MYYICRSILHIKNTSLWAYDEKHKTKIQHIVTSISIKNNIFQMSLGRLDNCVNLKFIGYLFDTCTQHQDESF